MDNLPLIHRLNRIQGQIEAIKKDLQDGSNKDCLKVMRLVKAANNAMKKFGEAYITSHMEECIREDVPSKSIEKELKEVINSIFSM